MDIGTLSLWIRICFMIVLIHTSECQNRPKCPKSYYSATVTEPGKIGNTVLSLSCSDVDNNVITYGWDINGGGNFDSQFALSSVTGVLTLNKLANAEYKLSGTSNYASPYTMRVLVKDKDGTTVVTLFVVIKSINDNTPFIVLPSTKLTVSESTKLGTVLTSCTLDDLDLPGSGHDIPYVKIIGGNAENKFAVDYITGDLMLINSLDYEKTQSYVLQLLAYDEDPVKVLSSTSTLTITVQDYNDNAPNCSSYNIIRDVEEVTALNTVLETIVCSDVDTINKSGVVNYKIIAGNFNSTLKVNTTTGQVTLNKQLDFDLGARYLDITVEVSDLGTPSLSTTVMLGFRVSDCDDNPPVFTPSVFTARVRENADVGTLVLYLSATDADSPNTELSRITFGFESPCSKDWFKIDQYTGAIFVKELLDWETAPNVTCQVYAYSSTKFADRSKTVVTISLDDINDRAPEFTKYLFEGSVVENAVAGTFVMNVKAVEYEYGLNGIFKYSMPDNSTFAIDANSGAVTLTGAVDYEQDTIFLVLVQAADEGTPSLTSQTFVNIKVLPVNEFTPVLKALAAQNILENVDPGTETVQVSSTDADHGDDGKVLYYLQDPNVPFILKQETGMLSASSGINAEVTDHYDLVILAVDQSKTTKRTGTTTLRVNIEDVNDNPPLCQPVVPVVITAPYSLTSPVVKLLCSDADLTGKTLSYREVGGDPTDVFNVNSLDGTIKLNFLDDQTVGVYKILYEISDSGDPSLTSTLAVEISIRTNLKFTSLPTGINVYENASVSQILYNISATGTFELINYAIKTGNVAGFFNLHQTLGTLRLVRALDRETSSSFTLGLTATTPSGLVTTSTLAVTVLDCNDNAPKFSNSFYSLSLSETLAYPTTVKTITATDSDSGDNAAIKYSIISGNTDNTFIYVPNSGNLILQKALDFEQTPGYSLTLLAVDQGTPQLSSTTIVFVAVVNENEPRPIVISPGYTTTLTLAENTAVGSNVLHIPAGDPAGEADLRYSLANEIVAGSFSIDERLGDVYLNYELDRETNPMVIFDVRVTNINGQSNTTHVIITVSDVNDNDPQFGTGNFAFTTPHGTPPGVVVGVPSVTDPDEGSNADLTLSIVSGNDGSAFTITGSSLTTSTRLDAYVQDTYTLVVMATDAGNPQRSSSAYVTVLVEPEVKPPKFVPNSDTISVEETRTPGSILYDLDATAAGARENQDGDLIYSVKSGNSDSTFNVEVLSGGIQLAGPLSYTRASVYNLVVTANNIKNISVSDEFALTITVLQVNLHAPTFSSVVYSWAVDETAAVGTAVGQVLVTDDDLGLYGTVAYSLTPSSTFIIDNSGRVILNVALEYSTTASYNLVVMATDNAGVNSLSSSCLVLISVKDSNNHAPVFTVTTYDVTIPETLSTKETFFSVWATDLDSDANGISGYKIISGNVNNTFIIDNTGALQVNLHLDYESVRKYTLTVAAVDSGGLSGTAQVTVNVLDENDYVPYFNTHIVDIAVDRDTPVSTPVFTASAVDRDAGPNGVVRYVIKSGNDDGLFSIDVATGVVKTVAALGKANQYQNLIVYGIDRGLPALTGTLTLGITLTPVLSPPSGDYSFSVKENLPVGTYVGTILANAPVTVNGYKITSGNYAKGFSIIKDATTRSGLLKTNKMLDREDFDIYQLVVEVLDTSGTYTEQYVVVEVTDQNDNAPTFDSSTLQMTTVEHLTSGHVIGRVGVADNDGPGVNSEVDLSISPLTPIGSVYFSIDSAGDLTLKQALNHDVAPTVVLYIVATDRGSPKLSSTGTVTVTVADVKETASNSTFETTSYVSHEFPSTISQGDLVCKLTLQDFGKDPATIQSAAFASIGANVFNIDQSGAMTINMDKDIYENSRYFQWVILTTTTPQGSTANVGVVRLDTFIKHKHVIAVVVAMDQASLEAKRSKLRDHLQTFYPSPYRVVIWDIQSTTSTTTRRRLLASESVALVVVQADQAANDINNVDMTKTFLTQGQALPYLQASPDGTPVSGVSDATFAVTKVAPYSDTSSSSDLNTAIIVLIVFACVTAVAIIVAVAILTYCCVCRKKQSEDKRALLVGRDTVVSDFNPPRKPDPRPTISPPPSHHDDSSYDFSDAQDLSDVSDMEDTNLSETISLTSLPHPTEDEGVATTRNVGVSVIASDIPETKPKVKPEVEFRTPRTHKAPVITQFAEYIPPQIPPKPPTKVSYAKYIRSVLNLPAEPETGARRKSELTDVEEVEDKTKVDGQTKSD